MIQTDLVSLIQIQITTKERSLRQSFHSFLGESTLKLSWQGNSYIPSDSEITLIDQFFQIPIGGIYYVYCRLMVGQNISKVVIRTNSSELFSTSPTSTGVVQMFGLVELPRDAKLHVEVELKQLKSTPKANEFFNKQFPGYSDSRKNPNSFGMFLVR